MKDALATLKVTSNSAVVRAVAASAVLVPLAAIGGRLAGNHNETLVRDRVA